MKNFPLVSVILPTYNVEKYLQVCLDSIFAQTYRNFEVIIIIDGATDRSYDIALRFCQKHPNFFVYVQDNAGSGPARNNGISRAKGELLMFVDPDDWICPELIEKLVNAQVEEDYDLTTSQRKMFVDNGNLIVEKPIKKYIPIKYNKKEDLIKGHIKVISADYCCAPTRTLYKKSIIDRYNIRFPSLRRSQDVAFNCLYYTHINSFRTIDYVGYCYRVIPKEGLAKNRSKYHETFKILYSLFNKMYDIWGVPYPKSFYSSFLFEKYLYSSLKMCVEQGVDIRPMLDSDVRNIIQQTRCKSITANLIASLINIGFVNMAIICMRLVLFMKKIYYDRK